MITKYSKPDNEVAISIYGREFLKESSGFNGQNKSGYKANPLKKTE